MRHFKKIVETTIINENGEEEKTTKITKHTIRDWKELSLEKKQEEIRNNAEGIYELYQENMYESYKCELDNLRYEFKNIHFEDIYMDSNSQGWWIDRIKNFSYSTDSITIYGEQFWVTDIDFKIRKLIEDFTLEIDDYYIEEEKLERIRKTKKYQKWIDSIVEDMQKWVDRVNEICSTLGNCEYSFPSDYEDPEDKDFLDYYFEDMEFEEIEEENIVLKEKGEK